MLSILMVGGLAPWDPQAGGGQLVALKLAEALADAGHTVGYLFKPSVGEPSGQKPAKLIHIAQIADRCWPSAFLQPLMSDHVTGYDIIHVHAGSETLSYYLGCALRRFLRRDVRLALTIHAPKVHAFPRSFDEVGWMLSCRAADRILGVSEFSRRDISACYKIAPAKIEVVYNGVDDAIFVPKRHQKRPNEGPFTLLFCGRLNGTRQKGLEILLEAMPLMLHQHDVSLNVIGVGPTLEEYKAQAEKLAIESRVKFLGFVEYSKLPGYYTKADLLVLPSRRESFGLVLAEAMACGLPVVATTAGAIPEVVEDGVTGVLVPPDAPEALAEAINSLLGDPETMAAMGMKGRQRVEKHFTWERVAQRVIEGYDKML